MISAPRYKEGAWKLSLPSLQPGKGGQTENEKKKKLFLSDN